MGSRGHSDAHQVQWSSYIFTQKEVVLSPRTQMYFFFDFCLVE